MLGIEGQKALERESWDERDEEKEGALSNQKRRPPRPPSFPSFSNSLFSFFLSPTPHLEAQVVPSGVDLARPLHGLALDKVDPQAVAEEPVAFFWEEEGKSGGSRKG